MKLQGAIRVLRGSPGFPRRNAGASLKRPFDASRASVDAPFPPQKCGGLIEAMSLDVFDTTACDVSPAEMRGPH